MVVEIMIGVGIFLTFCVAMSFSGAKLQRDRSNASTEAMKLVLQGFDANIVTIDEARRILYGLPSVQGGNVHVTELTKSLIPTHDIPRLLTKSEVDDRIRSAFVLTSDDTQEFVNASTKVMAKGQR